jgi:hypothetical protein
MERRWRVVPGATGEQGACRQGTSEVFHGFADECLHILTSDLYSPEQWGLNLNEQF